MPMLYVIRASIYSTYIDLNKPLQYLNHMKNILVFLCALHLLIWEVAPARCRPRGVEPFPAPESGDPHGLRAQRVRDAAAGWYHGGHGATNGFQGGGVQSGLRRAKISGEDELDG